MKKFKIDQHKEQVLRENYNRSISCFDNTNPENIPYTIAEWCKLESASDPNFYRWLFNDDDIEDFGDNLTNEQKKFAFDFFNTL